MPPKPFTAMCIHVTFSWAFGALETTHGAVTGSEGLPEAFRRRVGGEAA
jgi:hypothetical protein